MTDFFQYVLFGAVIGLMSGIFGIGGSSISTPLLKIIFQLPDLIALASPLPVTIPTAVAGTVNYWRKGLVRRDVVFWTVSGGLPGVVLGALGTKLLTGRWLMILTGAFVLFMGYQLHTKNRGYRSGKKCQARSSFRALTLLIGLLVGIFSGLLANGGGVLLVPAFILLLGISPHEAVSSSLVCVACFAIPGSLVHWWLGNIDWQLVLELSLGVIPASYLGSRLGLALGGKRIQTAFSCFLMAFGMDFIIAQFGVAPKIVYGLLAAALLLTLAFVLSGLKSAGEPGVND